MRKVLGFLALLVLCAPVARAEGTYQRKGISDYVPVASASDVNWGGFYTGLYLPWVLQDSAGGVGGVVGWRYQWSSGVVLGVEADAAKIWGSDISAEDGRHEEGVSGKLSWLGSARGYVGFALGNFLPYASVGWGWGEGSVNWEGGGDHFMVDGLVWGGGVEMRIKSNLSLKLDWSRYEFGRVDCVDFGQDVLSLKLAYKF